MKMCECCGEKETIGDPLSQWAGDCEGAQICTDCWCEPSNQLLSRIRSRRAASEAGPRDADGVVIRVGDRVQCNEQAAKAYTGTVTAVEKAQVFINRDDGEVNAGEGWRCRSGLPFLRVLTPAQGEASGFKVGDVVLEPGEEGREFSIERALGDNCFDLLCPRTGAVHHNVLLDRYSLIGRKATTGGPAAAAKGNPAETAPPGSGLRTAAQPPVDSLHFGPDSYPANPAYGIERERSNEERPPRPNFDYDQFCDLIDQHLVPQLPKDLKVVTDVSGGRFCCWVLDASGAEVWSAVRSRMPSAVNLSSDAVEIASALMAERARAGK